MSLLTDLEKTIGQAKNDGFNSVGIIALEVLVVRYRPPHTDTYLFIRFGCGHEQRLEDDDDAASFLENARHQPCDACVGKKLKSLDL